MTRPGKGDAAQETRAPACRPPFEGRTKGSGRVPLCSLKREHVASFIASQRPQVLLALRPINHGPARREASLFPPPRLPASLLPSLPPLLLFLLIRASRHQCLLWPVGKGGRFRENLHAEAAGLAPRLPGSGFRPPRLPTCRGRRDGRGRSAKAGQEATDNSVTKSSCLRAVPGRGFFDGLN